MLAQPLVSVWQRAFEPRAESSRPLAEPAAIHRYDPIDDFAAWVRCRDRAQFHLGRARRFKDRGRYREAAREVERGLQYDDTSEGYFQVLGQCHLRGNPRNLALARGALERALVINPRNGYTLQLLLEVLEADDNLPAARAALERALAAGAPADAWRAAIDRYTPSRAVLA